MYELDPNGQSVFEARLAAKNMKGEVIETFDEAVKRLAGVASAIEDVANRNKYQKQYEEIIGNKLLIPSTPIWANMGKSDRPWMPSACAVLGVNDSLHSMFQTLQNTAMLFKAGSGVGYNFSRIRPKGSIVASTKGQASGVVELIRLYDAAAQMVKQGGVRRGASMAILNVDHPEIMEFINCKRDGSIENFNLSVGVTEKFIKAVQGNEDWVLKFKRKRKVVQHKIMKARDIWDAICEAAWDCGDPGIIFIDRLQASNPIPYKVIWATNPCGEQPLNEDETCLLASVNFAAMVKDGRFDYQTLSYVVRLAVRFLDSMIDAAQYPSKAIENASKASRKIGLGFTGLGDALIKMGFAYNSQEGRNIAEEITKALNYHATEASIDLAKEKGCFPDWEKSIYYPDTPMRNASRVTVAPTGSVTTLAGCEAYGVEPIFGVAFTKSTNVAGDFVVLSPLFLDACKHFKVPQEAIDEVSRTGSCQGITGIPDKLQKLFVGGHEMAIEDHILMQAAVQKHVDNAVSKTINLPRSATVADVSDAYKMAYVHNLKGITIYRDGCKEGVVKIGLGNDEIETEWHEVLGRGEIVKRPTTTVGITEKLDTGCGKMYLTINHDADTGEVVETFITTGSDGGCLIFTEATSRLISLAIRGGIPVDLIAEQLTGTHPCPSYMSCRAKGKEVSPGKSCPSAIAIKLLEADRNSTLTLDLTEEPRQLKDNSTDIVCPECGANMRRAEGCRVCINCGFSKC